MEKETIKIWFTDFWPNFEPENNIFYNLIKTIYNIELDENKPDFLFYSAFGIRHKKYNCTRIYFTGENIKPDFKNCDYAFSFDLPDKHKRNYRLPQYYQYGDMNELLEKKDINSIIKLKTKFCNFIYSNPNCRKRNNFFKKLSGYKKVDSAGRFMNNIGYNIGINVEDKWEFLKPYKFTIAFENEEAPYYSSEKIFEAMKMDSIPIYWGNPEIGIDFNTESFINCYDYGSDEAVIEKIKEIDQDNDVYKAILEKPFFKNNELNEFVNRDNIIKQLIYIFDNKIVPVSENSAVFSSNALISKTAILSENLIYNLNFFLNKLRGFNFYKLKIKLHKIRHKQKF